MQSGLGFAIPGLPYGTLEEGEKVTKIALGFAVPRLPLVILHPFSRSPVQKCYVGNRFFSENCPSVLGFALSRLPPPGSKIAPRGFYSKTSKPSPAKKYIF